MRLGPGLATLWLLDGNARAERFYRADGWEPDGTRNDLELWGLRLPSTRFAQQLP